MSFVKGMCARHRAHGAHIVVSCSNKSILMSTFGLSWSKLKQVWDAKKNWVWVVNFAHRDKWVSWRLCPRASSTWAQGGRWSCRCRTWWRRTLSLGSPACSWHSRRRRTWSRQGSGGTPSSWRCCWPVPGPVCRTSVLSFRIRDMICFFCTVIIFHLADYRIGVPFLDDAGE